MKNKNETFGKWELVYEGLDFYNFHCSVCHGRQDVNCKSDIEEYKYCPRCGKEMIKWQDR